MIVRELLTRLGFTVDESGADKYDKRLTDVQKKARRISNLLFKGFGFLMGGLAANQLIRTADAMADYASRVRLAIDENEDLGDSMNRLGELAMFTYSSFDQTAEAFLSNRQALQYLGYSTEDTLNFTQALNDAMVVSGTKGDRAASVMNSLRKAMSAGALRGENFNNVLQNGGVITDLLIRKLGVDGPEALKQLAQQGAITSEVLYETMIEAMDELRRKSEDMDTTVSDGLQNVRTAMQLLVWSVDSTTGATGSLGSALNDLAWWIRDNTEAVTEFVGAMVSFIDEAVGWQNAFEMLLIAGSLFMGSGLLRYLLRIGGAAITSKSAFIKLGAGLGILMKRWIPFAAAVAGIEDLFGWARGEESFFGRLVGDIEHHTESIDKFKSAWDTFTSGDIVGGFAGFWDAFDTFAIEGGPFLREALEPVIEWLGKAWDSVVKHLSDEWDKTVKQFVAEITAIKNAIFQPLKDAWDEAISYLETKWLAFLSWLPVPSFMLPEGAANQRSERQGFTPVDPDYFQTPPAGSDNRSREQQIIDERLRGAPTTSPSILDSLQPSSFERDPSAGAVSRTSVQQAVNISFDVGGIVAQMEPGQDQATASRNGQAMGEAFIREVTRSELVASLRSSISDFSDAEVA